MKKGSVLLLVVLLFISMFTDVSTIVYATENEANLEKNINYSKRVTSSLSRTPGGFKNFQWQAYVKA